MTAVYTWGCDQGQLGDDNGGSLLRLVDFDNRPIKHVAAGRAGTAVLTEDGELFLFGVFGRTGVATKTSSKNFISDKILGVSCGMDCVAFYTEKNEVWAWGQYICEGPDPAVVHRFPNDVHIKQIACGGMHCLVLTNQGVYVWGRNNQGQMGIEGAEMMMMPVGAVHNKELRLIDGLKNFNIVQIACGGYHSLALTDAGEVYSFGAGNYGQLGTGNKNIQKLPTLALELAGKHINFIAAGPSHSIAISTDGKAYLFGRTESKQCNCTAPENACVQPVEVSIKDEYFVYGAAAHSCTYLVTVSGRIYSYGALWKNSDNVMVGKDGVFKDKIVHQIWCGHYHAIAVVGEMCVNISPSTFIANMQKAFTDTLHKDMTLETPHGKKTVHGVVLSSLSDIIAQKSQAGKSNVNIVEELKQLSSEQLDMLLKYCYGISSEVKPQDLKALHDTAKLLEFKELTEDSLRSEAFIVISAESLTSALCKTFKAQGERTSDITFTFDSSPTKLHAHKIILSSRCEYFRGLFDLGMKESKQNTMHISEWSAESFKVMLQFLYSDELSGVTGENALEVLQLATTYLIQRLIDKCEEFIVENMTLDNIVELYLAADTIHAKQIQRGCQFLVRREAPKHDLSNVPNYEKLTQAQKDYLSVNLHSEANVSDVHIELTPHKFIEKINADEQLRTQHQNRRDNNNNNNNNQNDHNHRDNKRCIIS